MCFIPRIEEPAIPAEQLRPLAEQPGLSDDPEELAFFYDVLIELVARGEERSAA